MRRPAQACAAPMASPDEVDDALDDLLGISRDYNAYFPNLEPCQLRDALDDFRADILLEYHAATVSAAGMRHAVDITNMILKVGERRRRRGLQPANADGVENSAVYPRGPSTPRVPAEPGSPVILIPRVDRCFSPKWRLRSRVCERVREQRE